MAIDFPNTPSTGQTFTSGSRTWTYDGAKWNLTAYGVTGPQGATGPQGPSGAGLVVVTSTAGSPSRPSSPSVGQNIYDTYDGSHLVYYGATTGWRPPWNNPWGNMGQWSVTTAASATSTTPVNTGLVITTPSLPANRRLKWTVSGHKFFTSVNDLAFFELRTGATSGGTGLGIVNHLPNSTTLADGFSFHQVETTASSAAVTRRLVVYGAVGTSGTIQLFADANRPAFLSCEDIGPATSAPPSP